jgi:hypothetical protein
MLEFDDTVQPATIKPLVWRNTLMVDLHAVSGEQFI